MSLTRFGSDTFQDLSSQDLPKPVQRTRTAFISAFDAVGDNHTLMSNARVNPRYLYVRPRELVVLPRLPAPPSVHLRLQSWRRSMFNA